MVNIDSNGGSVSVGNDASSGNLGTVRDDAEASVFDESTGNTGVVNMDVDIGSGGVCMVPTSGLVNTGSDGRSGGAAEIVVQGQGNNSGTPGTFNGGVNGHQGPDGMADDMGNGDDRGQVRDQLGSGNASGRSNGHHGVGAWPRRHTCGPTVGDGLRRYTCSPNDGARPRRYTFGQIDDGKKSSRRRRRVTYNLDGSGGDRDEPSRTESTDAVQRDESREQSSEAMIAGDPLSARRPPNRPRRTVRKPERFKDFM